jgi:phage tail sheath protein FI
MATPQLSPGILIREVDLTVGRADNVLDNIGAIAGPFPIGPVDEPTDITTENELIKVFGKPLNTDGQYEYWMSASSYLSYGGVLKVVRTSGDTLVNANANKNGVGQGDLLIKNFDDYNANYADDIADYIFTAKNPGSWANNLKVCFIDDLADQVVGIKTTNLLGYGIQVGAGVTVALVDQKISARGRTRVVNGYLKAVVTGVRTDSENQNSEFDVKVVSRYENAVVDLKKLKTTTVSTASSVIGTGSTNRVYIDSTSGIVAGDFVVLTGFSSQEIVSVASTFVTIASNITIGASSPSPGTAVTFNRNVGTAATEVFIDYAPKSQATSIKSGNIMNITYTGIGTTALTSGSIGAATAEDWYDQQTVPLNNSLIYWRSIAPKPVTTQWCRERNARNDALHVAIFDDTGTVTGIKGNLLEKHLNLSKASDAVSATNAPQKIWWKDYLARYSQYVYVGDNPSDESNDEDIVQTGFDPEIIPGTTGSAQFAGITTAQGLWNEPAQDKIFGALGNQTYVLQGGVDYSEDGGMIATLGDLITSYSLFENRDEVQVDYLIMGPGLGDKDESRAKAAELISIAESRKDCMAVLSPHKGDVVDVTNTDTQTDNIIEFFSYLPSSSYAVFDSGYKYTYDRFNNKFRYIPCNPDVAGLMVRTSIFAYPWFSPAGQQRGILNNAIKLAYNPNKAQRDQLYPLRINSIINQPGLGVLLFGDKTALGYASAFDRINVRRLFLTVEQALERTAQAQLFELNDQITRSNFVNIVEPYLRDVQAKRGIYDFLVVCDETNNTPDIIDNNEFRADIYLKPAKSINFVTLTFVATRTGVSFEEVAGRV